MDKIVLKNEEQEIISDKDIMNQIKLSKINLKKWKIKEFIY
ncbi:MAG: hypothetical protein Q7R87_03380 [Nanoarchaeota archaeon]|nr:hypothetical protein [Nanoarchaeota archaeon]